MISEYDYHRTIAYLLLIGGQSIYINHISDYAAVGAEGLLSMW